MMTRNLNTEFVAEWPNLGLLAEKFGVVEAGRMIGISHVGQIMRSKKVRPAYEMAAELCLRNLNQSVDRSPTNFLIKMTPEQKKILVPLLESMKIDFMDLDL
mgnify:CR=1 FL=1|tara:strand:+ start:88 stop:393 length:306 start_codon:yes stop_codon:yes gene_type:complete